MDADELSSINNGFINSEASLLPADHEVRNRKSESTPNDHDFGFSADWFEIEPSIFKSKCSKELNVVEKSPKSGLKQIVQCKHSFPGLYSSIPFFPIYFHIFLFCSFAASRKVDKSCRNKVANVIKHLFKTFLKVLKYLLSCFSR